MLLAEPWNCRIACSSNAARWNGTPKSIYWKTTEQCKPRLSLVVHHGSSTFLTWGPLYRVGTLNTWHHQAGQEQVETSRDNRFDASVEGVGIDLAIFIHVEKLEQLVSCVVPMAALVAMLPCRMYRRLYNVGMAINHPSVITRDSWHKSFPNGLFINVYYCCTCIIEVSKACNQAQQTLAASRIWIISVATRHSHVHDTHASCIYTTMSLQLVS